MNLLTVDEIKAKKEAELGRDILRTDAIKKTLDSVKTELNDTNARFEVALTTQRLRWATEEEDHTVKITSLLNEIKSLEAKRAALLIPIDDLKQKAHDLFKEAELVLGEAKAKETDAERERAKQTTLTEQLQDRLDDLSDREEDLSKREQKLSIKEAANEADRQTIKALSGELLSKLSKL